MSNPPPVWISALPAQPQLHFRPPLLRAEVSTPKGLEQLIVDLLAVCAGQRTWTTVLEEALAQDHFGEAAQAVLASSSDVPLKDRLVGAWSKRRAKLEQHLAGLRAQLATLAEVEAVANEAAEAKGWLVEADTMLAGLPNAEDATLAQKLQALTGTPLRDLQDAINAVETELDNARNALQKQASERRSRLRNVKQEADQLLEQFLFDDSFRPQADKAEALHRHILGHVRVQHLAKAEEGLKRLRQLHSGEKVEIPVDSAPTRESGNIEPPPSPPRLQPTLPEVGALHRQDLSGLAQRYLDSQRGQTAPVPHQSIEDYPVREWESAVLGTWNASAKGEILKQQQEALGPCGGPFLDSQAKLQLLRLDFSQSIVLFADLFRWSCHSPGDTRLRHSAAWGICLSLTLPYLPEEEQKECLVTRNLKALCERQLGAFPLTRLAQLGLLPELALWTLRLEPPYGNRFVSDYLLPFFRTTPPAAQDFLGGLIAELPAYSSSAIEMLALLFRDLLPSSTAPLSVLRSFSGDTKAVERLLAKLRESLLEICESSDLAQAAADALEKLLGQLAQRSSVTDAQVVTSLITSEAVLEKNGRLVLQVSCPEDGPSLHGLRIKADLTRGERREGSGKERYLLKALRQPTPIPVLRPGERREVPLVFERTDDDVAEASRVELSYTVASPEGSQQGVRSRQSSFAVHLQRPLISAPPWPPHRYVIGKPVTGKDDIYGREDDLDRICNVLIGQGQDNAVLVLGDRKIGKTTLLIALEKHKQIQSRYRCLRLDFQDLKTDDTAAQFFREQLIAPLRSHLASQLSLVLPTSESGPIMSPEQEFKDFIARCDKLLAGRSHRVLLILDELERLFEVIEQRTGTRPGALSIEVIATLRSALQSAQNISLVMAGVTDILRRRTAKKEDRLFRFAVEVELKPLSEEAARRLVMDPVSVLYQFTTNAVERIIVETNRQPYLIKHVCLKLYESMRARRAKVVTEADVVGVLEEEIVPHTGHFWHLTEPVKDPKYFVLIKSMAALQIGRRYVSVADVRRQLRRSGVDLSEEQITERLQEIERYTQTIIDRQVGRKGHYRLTVGLFARHLRFLQEDRSSFVLRS